MIIFTVAGWIAKQILSSLVRLMFFGGLAAAVIWYFSDS